MKRVCKRCEIGKELSEYYLKKNGGVGSALCKECYKDKNKKYRAENKLRLNENANKYYKKNKERVKQYYLDNKELILQKNKEYYVENKEAINLYVKKYKVENKETLKVTGRNYRKQRKKNDPLYKLTSDVRNLIYGAFKRRFTKKSKKTIEILGCTFEEFYQHLESKFDDKMNWDNQGSYWHIDHIKPISLAKNEQEVYELNHYTNFQPLYWEDNLKKSNKY